MTDVIESMGWQPIETAPTREKILMYWSHWSENIMIGWHDEFGWQGENA